LCSAASLRGDERQRPTVSLPARGAAGFPRSAVRPAPNDVESLPLCAFRARHGDDRRPVQRPGQRQPVVDFRECRALCKRGQPPARRICRFQRHREPAARKGADAIRHPGDHAYGAGGADRRSVPANAMAQLRHGGGGASGQR
ncbi:hypothetical protein CEE84_11560, partial [Lactobacillus crispatus]